MTTKNRTFIFIDERDYEIYKKLQKTHYFKGMKNIELFLWTTLVGLTIVKKPIPLNSKNKKDYIRVNDNKDKDSMKILKSIAITKFDDVNVLSDENKLFSLCENYANAGIKEIYSWYVNNDETFDDKITIELLKYWNNLDFEKINEYI